MPESKAIVPAVDYRALLMKYIQHVGEMEGTTFIPGPEHHAPQGFTDVEWRELLRLQAEILHGEQG